MCNVPITVTKLCIIGISALCAPMIRNRTRPPFRHLLFCSSATLLLTALPAQAQDDPAPDADQGEAEAEQGPPTPTIYVYGRGERRIGQAIAASEGGVAGADIEVRPLLRPGELLEA